MVSAGRCTPASVPPRERVADLLGVTGAVPCVQCARDVQRERVAAVENLCVLLPCLLVKLAAGAEENLDVLHVGVNPVLPLVVVHALPVGGTAAAYRGGLIGHDVGGNAIVVTRERLIVVIDVHRNAQPNLLAVGQAGGLTRLVTRLGKNGEQDRCQYRDYRDDHQQLDECEGESFQT
jgi:hypothetical protein